MEHLPRPPGPNSHIYLPSELLQTIFCIVADGHQLLVPQGFAEDPRVSVSHVCSYWRSVALNTPQLWANVVINLDVRPSQILSIATAILSRNPISPRIVTIRREKYRQRAPAKPSAYEFIDQLILPFATSIKRLRLFVPFPYVKFILSPLRTIEFPILESLSIGTASYGVLTESYLAPVGTISKLKLPLLAAVEVNLPIKRTEVADAFLNTIQSSRLTTFVVNEPLAIDICYHILSNCTHLISCGISLEKITNVQVQLGLLPTLVLPFLERFHIRYSSIAGFQTFLSLFVLPSVRNLALKNTNDGLGLTRTLSSILATQCGQSLEHLYIASSAFQHHRFSFEGFDEVIEKHAATLKRLYIPFTQMPRAVPKLPNSLIRRLVSRELCPNLESLSLEFTWSTAVRMAAIMDGVMDAEAGGREPVNELFLKVGYEVHGPIIGDITLATLKSKFRSLVVHHYGTFPTFDPPALEAEWFGYYG